MVSFLDKSKPTVTTMLKSRTLEGLETEIAAAIDQHTDALGISYDSLKDEFKSAEFFESMLSLMKGYPVYLCNYRRTNSNKSLSDDTLGEQLLLTLDIAKKYCPEVLIDVTGNMYDPSTIEISYEQEFVKRQKEFIAEVHSRGGLALMSSHMFKFMPGDDVLELARAHMERGADVSKIVTDANSPTELEANIITSMRLHRELEIPSLFLCNGSHCRKHRLLSPILGSALALGVVESSPRQNQPKLRLVNSLDAAFCEHELSESK